MNKKYFAYGSCIALAIIIIALTSYSVWSHPEPKYKNLQGFIFLLFPIIMMVLWKPYSPDEKFLLHTGEVITP